MKNYLVLAFALSTIVSFGQKRIGADINTHLTNLNYSFHYQEVIKGPLLYSAGVFFGGFGEGTNTNNSSALAGTIGIGSAYPSLSTAYNDSSGTHDLLSYNIKGKGFGVFAGIGLFHEFGTQHGIRFNLNNRFGWMKSDVSAFYYQEGQQRGFTQKQIFRHAVGAVTLELYHTMRLSGRNTFYWGFKMPYYYTLDKGRYNPLKDSELFYKLKLDLSVGLTRSIGSCD